MVLIHGIGSASNKNQEDVKMRVSVGVDLHKNQFTVFDPFKITDLKMQRIINEMRKETMELENIPA